jgi:hypothetical protein
MSMKISEIYSQFHYACYRYTKTVVAATVDAQKYNPELTWTQRSPDPRIAQLSDKLRHIRQVGLPCQVHVHLYPYTFISDMTQILLYVYIK